MSSTTSFSRPGAAAIREAGHHGALRYLSPPPKEKNLGPAQRDEPAGTRSPRWGPQAEELHPYLVGAAYNASFTG